MSRLTDFYARYPHITLHLYEQPIDATAPGEDIDLAITYGTGPVDSSAYFLVRPLPALQFFPVCSPGPVQPGHVENPEGPGSPLSAARRPGRQDLDRVAHQPCR